MARLTALDAALRHSVLDQGLADEARAAALSAMGKPGLKMLRRLAASPKTPPGLRQVANGRLAVLEAEHHRRTMGQLHEMIESLGPKSEPAAQDLAVPVPEPWLTTASIQSAWRAVDAAEAPAEPAAATCPPEAMVPAVPEKRDLSVEECIAFTNRLRAGLVRPEPPPESATRGRRPLSANFDRTHEAPPPARPALMSHEEFAVAMTERFKRMSPAELAKWFG